MKSHDVCTRMDIPSYCGSGRKGSIDRSHKVLLGMIILLIFCWTISSICLIVTRRNARSIEDMLERKATVALLLPDEMLTNP